MKTYENIFFSSTVLPVTDASRLLQRFLLFHSVESFIIRLRSVLLTYLLIICALEPRFMLTDVGILGCIALRFQKFFTVHIFSMHCAPLGDEPLHCLT